MYTTPAGPVYVSVTGPHAHGARDFVDTAHHAASAGRELVDLLEREALVDDALPASCECGPHVLSRKVLLQALAEGSRRILVG
ncbi:hypothetical protein [Crossiella equi]|uniref:hypothetical protein n=1 Tax=Crossiella equi TaxID=130796 RepID=UPI002013747D|nr:hypothetical protein [Crossiella equi]